MKNKILFIVAIAGIALALYSAHVYSQQPPAQPPVFNPAPNPYANGIYANGIVESFQTEGENINIYPEVPGPITRILVAEGQKVKKGTPLLTIDESVQRATAKQQKSQADAALALLNELKAQPRPETLEVAAA
jgi:HlyD family secretion protein